jgi:bifunctional non-homologous end joining protein LigD
MSKLEHYHQKRNFEQTSEPSGTLKTKAGTRRKFVVQRHHASRLHYDFRLEIDGVLKSWAVPKGPSLNPQDKRLAVQVEDHPVDYARFEGSIAEGNYGAGTVTIFDEGYFEPLENNSEKQLLNELKEGSLKFKLYGDKLQGEFALVRIKSDEDGKSWLLIKHNDAYAVHKAYNAEDFVTKSIKDEGRNFKNPTTKGRKIPSTATEVVELLPMLAKLTDGMPEDGDWSFEKKYDGFRIIAVKNGEKMFLYSRTGKSMNKLFPSVVKELKKLDRDVWLDGEVVVEDAHGKARFQLLASGEPIPANLHLRYYIFDILSLDDNDLTQYPLFERKELLKLLFKALKSSVLVHVDAIKGAASTICKKAEKEGWEGLIAKDNDGRYFPGKRSSQWLKVKFRQSQEAVICGFTMPQGSRTYFGAIVLGYYADNRWVYLGNCGTGFTEAVLAEVYKQLKLLVVTAKPFGKNIKVAKEREVKWVKPHVVCEVYYSEWTADQHLRHPVFKGLRTDKKPKEVQVESSTFLDAKEKVVTVNRHAVKLTNLDKIYWPKEGYAKGRMLDYYERYGDLILPYLKDKPISLHRFPNGIEESSFFQKDVDSKQIPKWVKTVPIYSDSTDKDIDYIICNNKATLLYIANLGSIEINPWLSTYRKIEKPDFAVLDLDPNGVDLNTVIEVAQTAHRFFQQAGVADYIKTSGSTGLHIYIYVKQQYTYDVVRDFIQLIGEMVHQEHPDTTSLVRDPRKRKGLIYLDFLQNRRGQTIAAPYSIRPKPGATVSTPLFWQEVEEGLQIQQFNIQTVPARLETKDDPWKNIFDEPSDIKQALEKF